MQKRRWIAPAIVLAVPVLAYVVFASANPAEALHHPPSHWWGLNSEDVSELLAWAGLVGLGLAIWQLLVTASAARAAAQAARKAVSHVERFDVAFDLVTSIRLVDSIADLIRSDRALLVADRCGFILENLAAIESHKTQLADGDALLVFQIINAFGSIKNTAERWCGMPNIPQPESVVVLRSIEGEKRKLVQVRERVRIAIGGDHET